MSNNMPVVGATTSAVAGMLTKNKVTQTKGGGLAFLKFDAKRTGEWLFGAAGESVTGEVFSLDVASLKHGQILWHAKKPNRRMAPLNQDLPDPQEPIHYTDAKGKPQVDEANEARSLEGGFEDGTSFLLEVSSFGGRKAVDALLEQLFARAAAGSPFLFPQVKLESSSYEHASYGQVFEPVLTAVAWFAEDGTQETDATLEAPEPRGPLGDNTPEPEPEEEPAPAPRRRKRKAA